MIKLFKNLKESWIQVVCIILLLCVQAVVDLKLPSFTSDIVNIGIQQGGIEDAVPEVISKSTFDKVLMFSNDNGVITNSYYALDLNEANKKEYPYITEETIYKLKSISKEDREELNNKMKKPLMIINSLNSINKENNQSINLESVSPEYIKAMAEEKIKDLPESVIEQGAIASVKSEYEKIGIDTAKMTYSSILKTGFKMLGVAFITMFCAVAIMFLSSRVAAKLGKNLRENVFKKVLSFSNEEFNKFSTASLITRSTNDIQQIQQLLAILFRVVFYAPIIAFGGIIMINNTTNMGMSWIIGLAVLIIFVTVLVLFGAAAPKFKIMQSLIDRLNLVAREILTGSQVIRAFNTQEKEQDRFREANNKLMNNSIFVNNVMSLMFPMMSFIMQGTLLLIVWVGGHSINDGIIQVGDMMAFIQYSTQILFSFLMISMLSIMLPRAEVSAKRINEILNTDVKIKDLPKEEQKEFISDKQGLVEFKNVSFKYPDGEAEVLSNIDFVAKRGETTAIIGSTGSGKSTVVNLIPRFFDVTSGEIYLDGVDIKDVSQKELHEKIGYVPQKGILFSGTIESNIKYGKDISNEKMEEVSEIAQASEFINDKEKKFETEIAQGGNNVSGGQKQRLSIARALAMDPEIFIFDDSFSALDLKTDRKLREALKNNVKDKTVIIVAQRVGTIMDADQIIVLEDGRIVGKGRHEELLNTCEIYKQIAMSQLSEEELHLNNGGDK